MSSLYNPWQTIAVAANATMNVDEVLDSLAHEFLLVKIKRELDLINDPEQLRSCCLQLVTLCETQKGIFKKLLYSLIEDDPEAQELFE